MKTFSQSNDRRHITRVAYSVDGEEKMRISDVVEKRHFICTYCYAIIDCWTVVTAELHVAFILVAAIDIHRQRRL